MRPPDTNRAWGVGDHAVQVAHEVESRPGIGQGLNLRTDDTLLRDALPEHTTRLYGHAPK